MWLRLFLLLPLLWAGALPAAQASVTPPDELVQQTTEEVLAVIRERQDQLDNDPKAVFDLIRERVLPHFDFELMSRFVLARNWRQASESQQQRFVEEFRELLVRTYGTSLSEYSGQEVRYLPMQSSGEEDDRVTVQTEILQQGGPAIPLDYKLHRTDDGWKVYDVVVDGASLVLNYRSQFASEVARSGIDGLIERLTERNAKGLE